MQRNLKTYINGTLRILNGTASKKDLKNTLIHICYSHLMKRNKINLLKLLEGKQLKQKNEIIEFCMLYFSRYLHDTKEFVMRD